MIRFSKFLPMLRHCVNELVSVSDEQVHQRVNGCNALSGLMTRKALDKSQLSELVSCATPLAPH